MNWEAWGALGQWAGAAATFGAVIVALRAGRPAVAVQTYYARVEDSAGVRTRRDQANVLRVVATNKGYVPVKVAFIGLRTPRGYRMVSVGPPASMPDALPWVLEPLRTVEYIVRLDVLRNLGVDCGFCVVVIDVLGRHYWSRVGAIDFFRRWWFLWFGKASEDLKVSEKKPPIVEISARSAEY